ncbi:Polynucleotide 5'-hydroxyl-kinase GRC3 [Colletotrichum chlorophyti]|uniref:Polynucleotide 5'-hydroxyl-kinase GRC3 n=1 Tax=Colletotrichum chlorophyti TaxID=708187 RepID=A0A1Q8S0U7_9PEZI|nr:Polynucleotide 5'-hydroxyl-kinase GRC3 [Colletotrichum chlorophyti]
MATPKRRKVETSDGSRPMSAFALRQQLLSASPSLSPASQQGSQPAPESQVSTPTPTPNDKSSVKTRSSTRLAESEKAAETLRGQISASFAAPTLTSATSAQATDTFLASNDSTFGKEEEKPGKAAPQQFSTFRPSKSNSRKRSDGVLELRLVDSERFLTLGSYGIRVTQGEIVVAGASIRPSDDIKWVHAPYCHAIPVLRCSEETRLELHPHPQAASLHRLEKLSQLFRGLWHEPEKTKSYKQSGRTETFKIICTSEDAPKRALIQDLRSHPAWNKKLAGLTKLKPDQVLSVMLCGPKSSGKSTFGRILGNRILTGAGQQTRNRKTPDAVVVLDLDPGQPEYTPAGTIALVKVREPNLGPSFTHVAIPENNVSVVRCHAIAAVSPASDPQLYLECALDLFRHYQNTCRGLPLIINTPGWILGTGLDLLTELASNFKPTEVIYMSEDGPRETVEGLQAVCKATLTTLPSQQSEFTSRTAAHLRSMQALAYFHTIKTPSGELTWDPTPLTSSPPLVVNYRAKTRGIFGIISYEYQPPADLLAETINGSVLCLVETEDPKAFSRLTNESQALTAGVLSTDAMDVDCGEDGISRLDRMISRTPEGIPFIPNSNAQALDPRYSQTLGLVLLRGIDTKNGVLQVITPIPLERIEAAKAAGHHLVLVHGKLDSPGWAYTEDLYYQSFGSNDAHSTDETVEVMDEDTESDKSDQEPENPELAGDVSGTPWIEVLQGHEKRPVGSRVWRVRRDLGRAGPGAE